MPPSASTDSASRSTVAFKSSLVPVVLVVIGALIRVLLASSSTLQATLASRVEIATPLTASKRCEFLLQYSIKWTTHSMGVRLCLGESRLALCFVSLSRTASSNRVILPSPRSLDSPRGHIHPDRHAHRHRAHDGRAPRDPTHEEDVCRRDAHDEGGGRVD